MVWQIPDSTRCYSESIGYVRMSCLIVGQKAAVREHLCNYCATRLFNGFSCRCTPITSANDGASCGFAIFRQIAGQKSVSECVGKATRTAFRTAARSMISCVIAPPIGGKYPNAAANIPKILNAIPPTAD